jgi:hypothetical protein
MEDHPQSISLALLNSAHCSSRQSLVLSVERRSMSDGNAQRETLAELKVRRRDVGTGMTREECTAFNQSIDVAAVRAYWDAVGEAVRVVARSIPVEHLGMPVDVARLHRMKEDGTLGNERAMWLPSFLEGKNKAWFLSMAVWHTAEHLLGGVVCVRRVSGVPLGI